MKFILGALIGGGVGYVLGTHAGREQFERIVSSLGDIVGQDVVKQVTDLLDQRTTEVRKAAYEGANAAADAVEGNGSKSE
jgi:tryptophan synthase beta subunit